MRKYIAMLLSLIMILTLTTSAAVIEGSDVQPLWNNIARITTDLSFSGNTATASVGADRVLGVTTGFEVSVAVYEQVGSYWLLVDGVYEEPTRSFSTEVTIPTESGKKYKAVFEVVAHSETDSETFEDTIIKTAPSLN